MGTVPYAMIDPDTGMGGARSGFPDTHLSAVRSAGSGTHERLIAAYWKPVYKYIRIKFRMPNEDAKDLTQAFFTRAIEKEFFRGYDPEKGTFRTYLRTCVDRFAANDRQYSARQKRLGDLIPLPLDFEAAESELHRAGVSPEGSPEEYFDREWTRGLFALALETLRREYAHRGKEIQLRMFERYDLDEDRGDLTYSQLAAEFDVSPVDVTNHLAAARRAFRRVVVEKLREMTAGEREFLSEARALGIEV